MLAVSSNISIRQDQIETVLAAAMAKDGLHQHPAVARWLEMAREDPLPEVRNAVKLDQEFEENDQRSMRPKEIGSEITP